MNRPRDLRGFTLVELMVTVGIVAVLAGLAYPSYRDQITRVRRGEMQSELMSLAEYLERKHAETGCYNAGPDNDCTTAADAGAPSLRTSFPHYTVTVISIGPTTYKLRARPTGAQAGDGDLYIDQAQRRWWDENNNDSTNDAGENDWRRG